MKKTIVFAAMLFVAWVSSAPLHAQAGANFAHNRLPLTTLYPTQASVMTEITAMEQSLVCGQQPTGEFVTSGTAHDETDSDWGAIALIAYWAYKNPTSNGSCLPANQNMTGYTHTGYTAAQAIEWGVTYALANLVFTGDPTVQYCGTQYMYPNRPPNTASYGQYTGTYGQYQGTITECNGDYADTAFVMLEKGAILKYTPSGTLTSGQISSITSQAKSHWAWLSQESAYNPEHRANQVMAAIVGAIWVGQIVGDSKMVTEAENYYDVNGSVTNDSSTTAYRNREVATDAQGYKYFKEDYSSTVSFGSPGFDTHYSGFQLTLMAVMAQLIPTNTQLYTDLQTDASNEVTYLAARLSESGTMHGGSRHNEISGSASDIALGLGYNYFGNLYHIDLGRVKQTYTTADDGPTSANAGTYGHRAMPLLFLHMYFNNWYTTPQLINAGADSDPAGFRKNNVSIHMQEDAFPQEISVNGTSFTEVLRNRVKAPGFFYSTSTGSVEYPEVDSSDHYWNTSNFIIRGQLGQTTSPATALTSTQNYYITDGTTLYVVELVHINSNSVVLKSASTMLGLPNVSTTQRIVTVSDPNASNATFDFSSAVSSYKATPTNGLTTLVAGDARIDAWPQLIADNVSSSTPCPLEPVNSPCYFWTDSTNNQDLLEDLFNFKDAPRVWYQGAEDQNLDNVIDNTDDIRVNIHANSGGDTYSLNDVVATVAVINPSTHSQALKIVPTYASGSNFKITSLRIYDGTTIDFTVGWSSNSFTDVAASTTIPLQ